jgi:hypothetical protein
MDGGVLVSFSEAELSQVLWDLLGDDHDDYSLTSMRFVIFGFISKFSSSVCD